MDLNRQDWMLLDYVWFSPISIRHLVDPKLSGLLNAAYHGLDEPELAKRLSALSEQGLVEITDRNRKLIEASSQGLRSQLLEPNEFSGTETEIIYSLTAIGGERWEEMFEMDWQLYAREVLLIDDKHGFVNYEGGSLDAIAKLYESLTSPDGVFAELRRSDVQIRERRPWKVTYWKSLPSGISLEFSVFDAESYDDVAEKCAKHALLPKAHALLSEIAEKL
ncbi:MAG: hypothetical protein AAF497_16380 [Planctomycetota bacterium]